MRLLVTEGPDKGRSWELREGEAVIGSHIDCAIVLADDSVSGRHATIRLDGQRAVVRDLGSRNGTFAAGARFTERSFGVDESFKIARTTVRVERTPQPIEARPAKDGIDVHSDLPYWDARAAVLKEFEHRYVVDILARHRGDVAAAAKSAGLEPKHLLALAARPAPPNDNE